MITMEKKKTSEEEVWMVVYTNKKITWSAKTHLLQITEKKQKQNTGLGSITYLNHQLSLRKCFVLVHVEYQAELFVLLLQLLPAFVLLPCFHLVWSNAISHLEACLHWSVVEVSLLFPAALLVIICETLSIVFIKNYPPPPFHSLHKTTL